jgi:hypothetical protein
MISSDALTWRINPALPVTKLLGAVALPVLCWAFGGRNAVQWVLVGIAVLALAGWALRDLIAPVRLAADPGGITVVAGFAGRRHLPWSQIEQVRVDRHEHRGLRSEMLEIDAGTTLHLFSRQDLNAFPDEVAEALTALRGGRT